MSGITVSLVTYLITIIISIFIALLIKIFVSIILKFNNKPQEVMATETSVIEKDDNDSEIALAITIAKYRENKN